MVENVLEKKEFPPLDSVIYLLGNLFLGGISYVLLRQYKRFFILYGSVILLMVAVVFRPMIFYLFLSLLIPIIGLVSAIDAYMISQKIKKKQIPEPKYNAILTWVTAGTWFLIITGGVALFFLTFM